MHKMLNISVLIGLLSWGVACSKYTMAQDASTSKDLSKTWDVIILPDHTTMDTGLIDTNSHDATAKDLAETWTDTTTVPDTVDAAGDTGHDFIREAENNRDNGADGTDVTRDTGMDEGASCVPESCETLDKECGTWPDNCGGQLNCGQCGPHQACDNGKCVNRPYCGDGTCQEDEDCASCPTDCGMRKR